MNEPNQFRKDAAEYLDTQRKACVDYLKAAGKLMGPECKWRPRAAAKTDVKKTWEEAKKREGIK